MLEITNENLISAGTILITGVFIALMKDFIAEKVKSFYFHFKKTTSLLISLGAFSMFILFILFYFSFNQIKIIDRRTKDLESLTEEVDSEKLPQNIQKF